MGSSFLGEGLTFVPREEKIVPVTICRASASGPAFKVFVRVPSIDQYAKISSGMKAPSGMRQGSDAAKAYEAEWAERYAKKIIANWEGCTIPNFEYLNRANVQVGGESRDEAIAEGRTIEFSVGAAAHLIIHGYADKFFRLIDEAAKSGIGDLEEEDEGKGEP